MKLTDKFNFGNGKKVRDKFISLDKSICLQEDKLTEDMFQVEYNEFIIDIGWAPEIDCSGSFRIFLIKKYNWEKPVLKFFPKDYEGLFSALENCLEYLKIR